KVIEPIRVRHRTEVTRLLTDLLVVAMQIAENWFEFADDLAFECHVHSKNAMGRRMLRPHRNLEELAVQARTHCHWRTLHCFECCNRRAHCGFAVICSAPSNCGRGV